jgi:Thrombospondin type 3 repeat
MRKGLLKTLIAAGALLALVPVGAQAATDPSCKPPLFDSAGSRWDLDATSATGAISDGGIDTTVPPDGTVDRSDSYDTWPLLNISTDGSNWTNYTAGTAACTTDLDGREVLYPPVTVAGLSVSRRVYVPATGTAFARFVNVLTNPGTDPVTVGVDLGGSPSDNGDLGSDSSTTVFSTSSGDTFVGPDDSWASSWDGSVNTGGTPNGDPGLGHVFESAIPGPDRIDSFNPGETMDAIFRQVTLAPGQTLVYTQYETQAADPTAAGQTAAALAAEPAESYAGLSDADRAATQNFCAGDCDRDGRTDGTAGTAVADNCPGVSNGDQADLDADGKGDACDDDIDGDGVSNAAEAGKGSDPRKADTDGDGIKDGADACSTVPGKGANGCPRFDDATAPKVTLKGVASKIKRKSLTKGIKGKVSCDEPCAFDLKLFGARKGAKIAKAGDVELASKKLGTKSGTRSFTLKLSRSLAAAVRKGAKLRLVVTASDAAHNSTAKTKTIRVK